MNPAVLPIIKLGIDALIQLWAIHESKPKGWQPTPEDWADLQRQVIESTPEKIMEEARQFVPP